MARRALWVCWPLRTVLALSTSPLRLRISSPRHQRGHTEPNLALYGHVRCWAAGGGPGGPYATITPPLLLGDWLAGGWGLSRHSWAGQCPGHVGTWAMLGEFSLHHHHHPQLVAQSLIALLSVWIHFCTCLFFGCSAKEALKASLPCHDHWLDLRAD